MGVQLGSRPPLACGAGTPCLRLQSLGSQVVGAVQLRLRTALHMSQSSSRALACLQSCSTCITSVSRRLMRAGGEQQQGRGRACKHPAPRISPCFIDERLHRCAQVESSSKDVDAILKDMLNGRVDTVEFSGWLRHRAAMPH